jgi:hypothetical protein
VAISPDVVSFVRHRFDCCDLLQRSVIRNVAPKASSVTLTTGMVETPSRRWKPRPLSTLTPAGAFHFASPQLAASPTWADAWTRR